MQTAESTIFVVDTNVWVVAESVRDFGVHCQRRSLGFLTSLYSEGGGIAVDSDGRILEEYRGNIAPQLAPHRILIDLLAQDRVVRKTIGVSDDVAVLPNGLQDAVHDADDRKFVAVSLAFFPTPPPPIVNATDSDWTDCEDELRDYGVEVIQLCPELFSHSRGTAQD